MVSQVVAQHPLTNTRTHDNHNQGVPALTRNWTIGSDGQLLEAYDHHDYLYHGSDSLSWPHRDGLGWPHLVGVSGGVTV
jgi:hypothetical protein